MKVTPVRFTGDVAAMRRFLVALGLTSTSSSPEGSWVSLEAAGGGEVGLHDTGTAATPHEAGTTDLAFATTEPLETVAARLQEAGFPARIDGRVLHVTDPDGRDVQVHGTELDLHGYSEGD
ncbi:VOC family protein [Kineococcus sp. LSe6-4]|uniref:VOC family protein n=1 Tax=Kineococcus halophytocola TaxID=3234027 RepID=A0ABV4H2H6_9ACTN